eukprot:gene831-4111_t
MAQKRPKLHGEYTNFVPALLPCQKCKNPRMPSENTKSVSSCEELGERLESDSVTFNRSFVHQRQHSSQKDCRQNAWCTCASDTQNPHSSRTLLTTSFDGKEAQRVYESVVQDSTGVHHAFPASDKHLCRNTEASMNDCTEASDYIVIHGDSQSSWKTSHDEREENDVQNLLHIELGEGDSLKTSSPLLQSRQCPHQLQRTTQPQVSESEQEKQQANQHNLARKQKASTAAKLPNKRRNGTVKPKAMSTAIVTKRVFKFVQNNELVQLKTLMGENKSQFNPTATDDYGWSILHVAASAGHLGMIQWLVSNIEGIPLNQTDPRQRTAADLARVVGRDDIAMYLDSMEARTVSENKDDSVQSRISNVENNRDSQHLMRSARKGSKKDSHADETIFPESDYRNNTGKQTWYCEVCNALQSGPEQQHKASIIHQFNCQHPIVSHPFLLTQSNKGYRLLKRLGWDEESGLGPIGTGKKQPVKTVLKRDRKGLGTQQFSLPSSHSPSLKRELLKHKFPTDNPNYGSVLTQNSLEPKTLERPRITHFQPNDIAAIKNLEGKGKPVKPLKLRDIAKEAVEQSGKERYYRRVLSW